MSWEFGVSRHKPLHVEWTNDKVLLYSTANYIQSPGINRNRKEHLKESVYMCVCVELSHLAVEQKLAQRCKSIMPLCLIVRLRLTLCDPMDCSPPGSSVPGMLQARTLEWVAMPSSRGPSQPRDRTQVSRTAGRFFTVRATREAQEYRDGKPVSSPGDLLDPGIKLGSPALQADSLLLSYQGSPNQSYFPACPLHERSGGWWDNLQGDSGPHSPRRLSPDGHPGLCPVTAPIPMSSAQPEL